MRTLFDIRNYASKKGLSERTIERLIDEVNSNDSYISEEYYQSIIFGIDCETEGI